MTAHDRAASSNPAAGDRSAGPRPLKVLQILPELNAGGVERGTIDLARELVARGHRSWVVSAGGRMVESLEAQGSTHITLPVHRKSLVSLRYVRPLRRVFEALQPDIVHMRSRLPAWLTWLAWRKLDPRTRPHLVTTFHGMYSVNRYSAIMGCGETVIAISAAVRAYILDNYPRIDPARITLIHRGVDVAEFPRGYQPDAEWRAAFAAACPQTRGKRLLLMPGRLSRWKGQEDFIALMAALKARGLTDIHGLIVGGAETNKRHYEDELRAQVAQQGLADDVSFLGHRRDMRELYAASALVCNLSNRPEPFGRTVTEALSIGTPVVAYDQGGPAEVLRDCYPQGLATPATLADVTAQVLATASPIDLKAEYTLATQVEKTLQVYQGLVRSNAEG
ncbi:MAG TPA: glycosyltransferase family 4 protein [Spongiibacteraceae bacterium]|nr:glycosyltransferase family 4 protein [Spongiibacteraceae bacterium]